MTRTANRQSRTKAWLLFSLVAGVWLAADHAPAAVVPAASCQGAAVQAAIDAAADGDTVQVPAGACTWSDPVRPSNARGLTLACATPRSCAITVPGTAVLFDTLSGQNARLYRISGFDFRSTSSAAVIWILGNGTLTRVRVDDNHFDNGANELIAVFFGSTETIANYYGVVDHNRLTGSANATLVQIIGDVNPNPPPNQLGSGNNLFVEDNVVAFSAVTNAGKGCLDLWGNGAVVWRRNQTVNCLVSSHGVTHAGGPQNLELYANDLRVDAGAIGSGVEDGYRLFHHQGSGTFIAFDNRFTAFAGKSGSSLEMTHYRSATPEAAGYPTLMGGLGRCDGTNPRDGNRAGQLGYPCWRQPGRDFAGNLVPMYAWNNAWSDTGARVPLTVADPWGANAPSVFDHLAPERDYYNSVAAAPQVSPAAPFSGANGMGFGSLANRPATCTSGAERGGGVGYYAADAGILYQCVTGNAWVPWYAPYVYPHPLVSGRPAPPPVTPPAPGAALPRCDGRIATIVGTDRGERLVGTAGRDVIVAKGGGDTILGRGGNDIVCAGAGNDLVAGGTGNDRLFSGNGNDRVLGGDGGDLLAGGAGIDRLEGGNGPDRLLGADGGDLLVGGAGGDRLDGGRGRDRCLGGPGRDRAAACERVAGLP